MRTLRILTVDDHEMTMLGYKFILEDIKMPDCEITVETANSFDKGKQKIEESKSNPFDIIFLDIQLFPAGESQLKTGEDLGKLARKVVPNTKIIFLSSFSDNFRINSILSSVNPEGYMVKTEIDEESLEEAVKTVLTEPPYYTKKALVAIRTRMANDIHLDDTDKKILYHLSLGVKTKDLVNHVALSLPGIENRKRHLKTIFEVEKRNDKALVEEAKRRGFL